LPVELLLIFLEQRLFYYGYVLTLMGDALVSDAAEINGVPQNVEHGAAADRQPANGLLRADGSA
jgi:hypothetical protein